MLFNGVGNEEAVAFHRFHRQVVGVEDIEIAKQNEICLFLFGQQFG
jgi:hypothetical protein